MKTISIMICVSQRSKMFSSLVSNMVSRLKAVFIVLAMLNEFHVHAKERTQEFIDRYKYTIVCKGMGYKKECSKRTQKEKVAFHARLFTDQKNLQKHAVVLFKTVTLNFGNAYDDTNGKFTAPDDGIYSFSWTIVTQPGKQFSTEIVTNGKTVGYNNAYGKESGSNYASGTGSAVIRMRKNDKVWIKIHEGTGEFAYRNCVAL